MNHENDAQPIRREDCDTRLLDSIPFFFRDVGKNPDFLVAKSCSAHPDAMQHVWQGVIVVSSSRSS